MDASDLGGLIIDPAAEPVGATNTNVSAQQEANFYANSGAQFHLLHNQQNLGYLGKFFGANSSAPTNIAGFVILSSFTILILSLLAQGNTELAEARKWLIGLITSALSFIFGAASKK